MLCSSREPLIVGIAVRSSTYVLWGRAFSLAGLLVTRLVDVLGVALAHTSLSRVASFEFLVLTELVFRVTTTVRVFPCEFLTLTSICTSLLDFKVFTENAFPQLWVAAGFLDIKKLPGSWPVYFSTSHQRQYAARFYGRCLLRILTR